MRKRTHLLAACWIVAASCAPAAARSLRPEEVLVVANADARGSIELARYYAVARDILSDRILTLHCTSAPEVGRDEYNKKIRDPIREYLRTRDREKQIRCLALMWGVPVRVAGEEMPPDRKELLAFYKVQRTRRLASMDLYLKMMEPIAVSFPAPRTKGLRPLNRLFDEGLIPAPDEHLNVDAIKTGLAEKRKKKVAVIRPLRDAARRRIALRQLAAIDLHAGGLKFLRGHPPAEPVPEVPAQAEMDKQIRAAQAELDRLGKRKATVETAGRMLQLIDELDGASGAWEFCDKQVKELDWARRGDAAVDNELPLLWEKDYPLDGPRPNPMNWRLVASRTKPADTPGEILMACRIDGPHVRDALRIIKDSIATEKKGLSGKFYIDAGGRYPAYDKNLLALANIVRKHTKLQVVLDTDKRVFGVGACPDAALYVGWYSLAKYVPAFTWARGSVGWHVASLEAVHLRAPASKEWCVKMIENGVAATIGAVNEPFLAAFPMPQEFFALLLTGEYTVADCYWRTVPQTSWRMTLIADPLYNPFRLKPQFTSFNLPPALAGREPASTRNGE